MICLGPAARRWQLRSGGIFFFDVVVLRRLEGVDYTWDKGRMGALTGGTFLLFVSVFLDFLYIFRGKVQY